MKFKVGDLVRVSTSIPSLQYVRKSIISYGQDPDCIAIGSVEKVWEGYWLEGKSRSVGRVDPCGLELAFKELKYNPEQMLSEEDDL